MADEEETKVTFQNEYLAAENGIERVTVPDIITLLNKDSLEPVMAEEIKCGRNVHIITMPSYRK